MNLTRHFSLEELTASQTAARLGLDNEPSEEVLVNLRYLAQGLEHVRRVLGGVPVIVSSGYRSEAVNRAVGGAKGSAHLSGLAADFIAPDAGSPLTVARRILAANVVFDQLIHEYGRWVHISFRATAPRYEVLTIDRQGTRIGLHEARV